KPEVIIMDEPSTGLDPLVQRELQKMMREVVGEGRTVFLSSHTLSEVQRVADRVGIIRHGKLIALEAVHALRAKAMRQVELELDAPADVSVFEAVDGVRDVRAENNHVLMTFGGDMGALIKAAEGRYSIVDLSTHAADLEEIFLTYYEDEEVAG
ncbi:MAG: ABC transporter ATP-binding protein, partial [Thermoleophilia bacterium]|nr:ABC transporter ATP-binding protein [Thermoleophilia bacterium]